MSEETSVDRAPVDAVVMTPERYRDLMTNDLVRLTDTEYQAGWHFCFEWDGLLVGPGMSEIEACNCPHRVKTAS